MEQEQAISTNRWGRTLALVCLFGLLVWQGWLTLTLFGRAAPWDKLTNAEPVVSGFHPLHQYHGVLGAQTFLRTKRSSCYDPAFQAGYPKTPVFDHGSRPAELFFVCAGGAFRPVAYKIGLALICMLLPVCLIVAARGLGLCAWGTVFAVLLGQLVWWGGPAQRALHVGDVHVLLAGLMLAVHIGLLVLYDRSPGVVGWLGLIATASLGWFAHPLLFALLIPVVLIYYLGAGTRHRSLFWHIFLWGSQLAAVGANLFWLHDWVRYWWVHAELPKSEDLLAHRTFRTIWEAPLWGETADRVLILFLLASGLLGAIVFQWRRQRSAVRVLALANMGLLVLAVFGVSWDYWGKLGTSALLVPALWFAVFSAAYAWATVVPMGRVLLRRPMIGGVVLGIGAAAALWAVQTYIPVLLARCVRAEPLEIGLGPQRQQIVQLLCDKTTDQARILWEDRPGNKMTSRWTALLPLLTERNYVGGLDPVGWLEHSHAGFIREQLAGKEMVNWSDAALAQYCKRYNIGWIIAWSPVVTERLRNWSGGTEPLANVVDGTQGQLLQVKRKSHSYALHGQATLLKADGRHISLAKVIPVNGKVVLSFHYQSGLRVSPRRVKLEREPDAMGPLPLLRLRVDHPVSRLTLTWE